jgi:acetyl-CoA carboxylase biotin carboxyl carrier protein
MNENNIRKYAELMKELDLTALEIKEDGSVRLERMPAPVMPPVQMQMAAPAVAAANAAPVAQPAVSAAPAADYISVKSPMIGVFYASPAENAEPFVKVGDKVSKGQTLCIIEAMKLMNELPADQDGVITEICVQNGQVVDYGCELFRMKRA